MHTSCAPGAPGDAGAVDVAPDEAVGVRAGVAVGRDVGEILGQVVGAAVRVLIVPRRRREWRQRVPVCLGYGVHVLQTHAGQIWNEQIMTTLII